MMNSFHIWRFGYNNHDLCRKQDDCFTCNGGNSSRRPTSNTSNTKTNNQVVLSWADNATNELNYLIERCKGATCTIFSEIASVGGNAKTFSNTGISRNTNYTYRVRASNAVGKSAYSNTLSVKTLP
ncbi:MAG: fibronectin type III domain-containing protein [Methylococcaceae bacterium]|nr:fibronectin type III domain-containing protein [Methylococcaceae bacterium]